MFFNDAPFYIMAVDGTLFEKECSVSGTPIALCDGAIRLGKIFVKTIRLYEEFPMFYLEVGACEPGYQ